MTAPLLLSGQHLRLPSLQSPLSSSSSLLSSSPSPRIRPSYPFLVGNTSTKPSSCKRPSPQTQCCPQRLGVEVPCHTKRQSLWRPEDQSSWGKMKHPGRTQVGHKAVGHKKMAASAWPDLEAGMAGRPLPRSVPQPQLVNKYLISSMSSACTSSMPSHLPTLVMM